MPELCFQHLPLRPRQVKVIMRGGCRMIKKDPVAADDAGNTSSLVDLHPRQWPPATHLLHYDAPNNIILRVFLHFSKVISSYCLYIKVKTWTVGFWNRWQVLSVFWDKGALGGYKPTMPDSFYPLDYYVPHHRLLITLTIDPPVDCYWNRKQHFCFSYLIVIQAVTWLLLLLRKKDWSLKGNEKRPSGWYAGLF